MSPLAAVVLGIVQGLTEFLPISSTAHLTLFGRLLGVIDPQQPEVWTEFMAIIQLGTLAAVIIYFWVDIVHITTAFFRDMRSWGGGSGLAGFSLNGRMALLVILATVPVVFFGLAFRSVIEGSLTKNLDVIAGSMMGLALLLWIAERIASHQRPFERTTWVDAVVIGCAQVLALIPGSSRSGTTITAGLFLGLTREAAARFSFLLSIPAVFGSGLYELSKIRWTAGLSVPNLVIATLMSAVTGYAAIAWLLHYLMKHTTMVFVWYRLGLGLLLVVLLLTGAIFK
jgi:undecaprenyl-diphosphatase